MKSHVKSHLKSHSEFWNLSWNFARNRGSDQRKYSRKQYESAKWERISSVTAAPGTGTTKKRLSSCRPVAVRVNSKGLDKASYRLCAYLFLCLKTGVTPGKSRLTGNSFRLTGVTWTGWKADEKAMSLCHSGTLALGQGDSGRQALSSCHS